jgi:hypothetical protein
MNRDLFRKEWARESDETPMAQLRERLPSLSAMPLLILDLPLRRVTSQLQWVTQLHAAQSFEKPQKSSIPGQNSRPGNTAAPKARLSLNGQPNPGFRAAISGLSSEESFSRQRGEIR